jgi:outer membrane protein OmpA-like peptidoglycan-associated protein
MVPAKRSLKGFVIAYFLIFGIIVSSYAQARIAIVGGVDESTVIQTSNQPDFSNYEKGYSPRVGFHIGLMGDFPLTPKSKFYFQPGIEFFNKGRKFQQITNNGVGDTAVYLTNSFQFINYIDIPLNLVYKFELAKKIALIVGFGPYISFFYDGKENSTTVGPDNYYSSTGNVTNLPVGDGPGQYRTLDYGVNALAGIYLGGSFITANFSRGLQNAYQDSTYSGTFKNQVFSVTLGVYLGERRNKKPDNKNDSTDSDCDGIIDKVDFCPTVPGLKKYNGCPIPDSDCDSINDEEDKCPLVAGLRRYNGCPIPDTDGDSVNDEEDKCPTAKGLAKYKGCPIPFDETLATDSISGDTMIYYIYYDPNRIRTNVKGTITLNKIHNLLKTNETLNIKISGYSDKNNSTKIAFKQSANRAIIVRNYMKKDSVAASRMKTYYWGSRKALVSRKDKPDQWKDRRVEIAVYQKIKKVKPISNDQYTANNSELIIKQHNKKTISRKNNQTVVYNDNIPDTTSNVKINNNAADSGVSETSNDKAAAVKHKNAHTKKSNQSVSNNNSTDTTGVNNAIAVTASDNNNYPNKKINAVNGQQTSNNNEKASDTSNTNINSTSITKSKQQTTNSNLSNTAIIDSNTTGRNYSDTVTTEKNGQAASNKTASNSSAVGNNNTSSRINNKTVITEKNDQTVNNGYNSNSAVTSNDRNNNKTLVTEKNDQLVNSNVVSNNTSSRINNKTLSTTKNDQTVKNNQLVSSNNSTLGTTENISSNKNADVVRKSNQQLSTDTANINETDQTISKIPPSQIDDTDKVLDCYTIYFDPNQSILNSASFDILDHIREILKEDSTLYIGISGYSERIGSEKSAQKLSQDRAYISRDYMNSYGVTIDRIRVSYWGSKIPVADDNDPYQQWENRRVEICIYLYPK